MFEYVIAVNEVVGGDVECGGDERVGLDIRCRGSTERAEALL